MTESSDRRNRFQFGSGGRVPPSALLQLTCYIPNIKSPADGLQTESGSRCGCPESNCYTNGTGPFDPADQQRHTYPPQRRDAAANNKKLHFRLCVTAQLFFFFCVSGRPETLWRVAASRIRGDSRFVVKFDPFLTV